MTDVYGPGRCDVRLRPFFPYYGSKWRLAPRYPRPTQRRLVEPFAGSAQYATLYPHCAVELYDADPVIVGVWRFLLSSSSQELLALPDLEVGASVDDLNLCQEARWLIGFWIRPACTHPGKQATGWFGQYAGDGTPQVWGRQVRERLAGQVARVKHWRVELLDYREIPGGPATWFVDPPYQGQKGKHYRHGSNLLDYGELGRWCRARVGEVVVCEAAPASWLPFAELDAASKGASGGRVCEIAWSRGFAEQGELFGRVA